MVQIKETSPQPGAGKIPSPYCFRENNAVALGAFPGLIREPKYKQQPWCRGRMRKQRSGFGSPSGGAEPARPPHPMGSPGGVAEVL